MRSSCTPLLEHLTERLLHGTARHLDSFLDSSCSVNGTVKRKVGSASQPLTSMPSQYGPTEEEAGGDLRDMLPGTQISRICQKQWPTPSTASKFESVVSPVTVARITATVQSEFSAIERFSAIICIVNENRVVPESKAASLRTAWITAFACEK